MMLSGTSVGRLCRMLLTSAGAGRPVGKPLMMLLMMLEGTGVGKFPRMLLTRTDAGTPVGRFLIISETILAERVSGKTFTVLVG